MVRVIVTALLLAATPAHAKPPALDDGRRFLEALADDLRAPTLADRLVFPFAYAGIEWYAPSIGYQSVDVPNTKAANACSEKFRGGIITRSTAKQFIDCLPYALIGAAFHGDATWQQITLAKLPDGFASQRKAIRAAAKGRMLLLAELDGVGGVYHYTLFVVETRRGLRLAGVFLRDVN